MGMEWPYLEGGETYAESLGSSYSSFTTAMRIVSVMELIAIAILARRSSAEHLDCNESGISLPRSHDRLCAYLRARTIAAGARRRTRNRRLCS